jgi:hypothetical protein
MRVRSFSRFSNPMNPESRVQASNKRGEIQGKSWKQKIQIRKRV